MSYFKDRFIDQGLITEARQTGDKGPVYTEERTTKELKKVIAKLSGTQSAALSKVAKRYERLDRTMKAAKIAHTRMNEELKDIAEGLFDAEDAIATRIVETCSFTLTLAKVIDTDIPKSEVKDYEKIANALAELIPEELTSKVEEIMALYTKEIPASVKPGVRKLSVKANVNEGALDSLKSIAKQIAAKVKSFASWAVGYDRKLDKLKADMAAVKAKNKGNKALKESAESRREIFDDALEDAADAYQSLRTRRFQRALLELDDDETEAVEAELAKAYDAIHAVREILIAAY